MNNLYYVSVGNIGNLMCLNQKEASKVYRDYVELSKSGTGRAGHEPVQLIKNGEIVKEFDPWAVVCRKGSFRERVWNILKEFAVDEEARFDLVSYGLVRNRDGFLEVNDAHFMCTGLEAHQALDAICRRYETWKVNYCPGARVKDLENIADEGENPMLEVQGIPFMEIRIS